MAGKQEPIDMARREEILVKLAESQFRSEKLAQEIEEKRQRLAELGSRVGASSFSSKRDIAEKAKKELYSYPKVAVPEVEPEINIEDTPEYKAEMERVQREVDAQAERLASEIKERCRVGADTKLSGVSNEIGGAFENKMSDVQSRYRQHANETIRVRSTDVLRTNKVVRDISRYLGANWKPVFLRIMASFPPDVVDAEVKKIEAERGFIQAYKALNTWKDMKGDDIVVSDLVNALRENDLYDLAEKTLDIMETNESDSLIHVADFGKGIKSASSERTIPARPQPAEGEEGTPASEEAKAAAASAAREYRERLTSQPSTEAQLAGALGDRKLLHLAKQIGHNWVPLAKALEVPNPDIQEIYNAEGDSYQGAFKAIYFWRDNSTEGTDAKVGTLTQALKKIDKNDLAEALLKE